MAGLSPLNVVLICVAGAAALLDIVLLALVLHFRRKSTRPVPNEEDDFGSAPSITRSSTGKKDRRSFIPYYKPAPPELAYFAAKSLPPIPTADWHERMRPAAW